MKRPAPIYGLIGGALIAVLKWTEYRFVVIEHSIEIYGGPIAATFAVLGIWLGIKLSGTRQGIVVKEVPVPAGEPFVPDERKREDLGITPRAIRSVVSLSTDLDFVGDHSAVFSSRIQILR
jgi:NarL family two-component system response regulator LiaR